MTVVFRTDGSVTRTGFRAVWEAVDNDGGEQEMQKFPEGKGGKDNAVFSLGRDTYAMAFKALHWESA